MPTFVTLSNFTEQGVKNVKDSVKRADAVKEAAKKKGSAMCLTLDAPAPDPKADLTWFLPPKQLRGLR